jgi:hypothetical protein
MPSASSATNGEVTEVFVCVTAMSGQASIIKRHHILQKHFGVDQRKFRSNSSV